MDARLLSLTLFNVSVLVAGCASPAFEPLPARSFLEQALAHRRGLDRDGPAITPPKAGSAPGPEWSEGAPGFEKLLRRLLKANPAVRAAWTGYVAALDRSRAGAPWEDPEIEFKPFTTSDGTPGAQAAVTLSLPLGGRLGRTRAVLAEQGRAALANARAVEMEQAFTLRELWGRLAVSAAALTVTREALEWARGGTELARKLALAGSASSVDVHLLATEERRARLALLEAEDRFQDLRSELGALLVLEPAAVPAVPAFGSQGRASAAPDREALLGMVIENNPVLARLEMEYGIAGRVLEVEGAKRVPDLVIGIEAESEQGGGTTVGIPFGFSLPLWNANTEAIAEARSELARAREAYRTELDRVLSALDASLAKLARIEKRLRILDTEITPGHRRALDEARRALDASDFDPLEYVEIERAHREIMESRLDAMAELFGARAELERTVGRPLFPLPGGAPDEDGTKKKGKTK